MSTPSEDFQFPYRLDDDWGSGGDDESSFDDDASDDDVFEDDDQQDDDQQDDDADPDDPGVDARDPDLQDGGLQDSEGTSDPQDPDEVFASPDDLPAVDDSSFPSAADFPNADASDFQDDRGDWTPADYAESAQNIFGGHEFFGDTMEQQRVDEGYQPYRDPAFNNVFDQIQPGLSDSVQLFERDGRLHAFGLVSMAVLQILLARYSGIDLSGLEVGVPGMQPSTEPKPLPAAFAQIPEKDAVDLRQYATPVGDQKQTSRCSAYAWTHGVEIARTVLNQPAARLSPNYTMLQFQKMQGDARDYAYAHSGGEGTVGGLDPGQVLVERGTCSNEMWPDDEDFPRARDSKMEADALEHRLDGIPWPIAVDDLKKVLSAGCPVHVAMNTGESFANVGRDGQFNAAEAPSGRHGRHAMLIVGYFGNFYIVKNSWGDGWGDKGFCYIPKNVLAESNAEFVALLLKSVSAA